MPCILTPNQIQYGGFIRASVKKIGDMIRDRVYAFDSISIIYMACTHGYEMLIVFTKDKKSSSSLTEDDIPINRVESSRILGLTTQNNMKWNIHVAIS